MALYLPPWTNDLEPNQGNVRQWLDNLYAKVQPLEQVRWNQSNIDTLFYAGEQSYVNRYFNFSPNVSYQNYYFNLIRNPINMVTGYQRQHRKSIVYQAADGADPQTTDQYTRLIKNVIQKEGINEDYSRSCELAAVAGLNLLQPYLDFTGDDPAQGQLKVKVWEYNSFLIDPYCRDIFGLSDCQYIWCQEYITKNEAEMRFEDKASVIKPMTGAPQRYGSFYFLPENYNMARNDLMVLSYVWYKWKKKKKRLYSRKLNQFFDFGGGEENMEKLLYHIDDMEEVMVNSNIWRVAVVLNDQLMFQGDNPLWDGPECPFIGNAWDYEGHINYYQLRSRSLTFPMRSPQFLFNYKIITNNDITSATINAGWKRKIGAVANEDNLKRSGQGWDVIINEGYELTDCEKIIPSGVPESDMALAQQMADLIYQTAGIDLENWSGQNDKQISTLTMVLKQAANLLVFQKYFDQWDLVLKHLGERLLQLALYNWNAEKVKILIGEEPSPFFYSRLFAKYKTIVEEGIETPTQRNLQAQKMLEINQTFQREVIPASLIIPHMDLQGKAEILQYLQQQEEQASKAQAEAQNIQHAVEAAKLQELYSKAANNVAMAKERYGRFESNVGLLEERISEVSKNHSLSVKTKMEALEKMIDVIAKFGEIETNLKMHDIQRLEMEDQRMEDADKEKAKKDAISDEFVSKIMNGMGQQNPSQEQKQMA
ncbi:MAG TPA: hypothetical protein VK553_05615 [Candidatus Nitrosopolaris rasttigaisensis]|nr:hypothetical protein [Candidatus Nitrosopolaris rasttigaisensis]